MPSQQSARKTPYSLLSVIAFLCIGTLLVSANIREWHAERLRLESVLYFAVLYSLLASLSFPVIGKFYAGIEDIAVLSALLSLGPLGAILAAAIGYTCYEVALTSWEYYKKRPLETPLSIAIVILLNIAIVSFGVVTATWLYQLEDGKLPLSALALSDFPKPLVLIAAYAFTTTFITALIVRPSLRAKELPLFRIVMLRFGARQLIAQSLAMLVALAHDSGSWYGNLVAALLVVGLARVVRRNEQNYRTLTRRAEVLAILNNIGQVLSRNSTVDDLVENLYLQVSRVMDASIFYVALYDAQTDTVRFPLIVRDGERHSWKDAPPSGITGYIIKTGKPFLMRGTLEETSAQLRKLGIERLGVPSRCYLGVPMLAEGAVLGVIAVQSLTDIHAYDQDDLAVLEIIAAQAASALQNIRLYDDLLDTVGKLALLNEASAQMIGNFDEVQLLESACQALRIVGNAQSAAIFLFDAESQAFALRHAVNLPEGAPAAFAPAHAACLQAVLQQSAFTAIKAISELPEASPWHTYAAWAGCQSLLALPLRLENQPLGVAVAHYSYFSNFEQRATELLVAFINQLAVLLANARHHADIKQRAQELTELVEASRAFTASLDAPHIAERLLDDLERLFAPTTLTVRQLAPDDTLELIAARTRSTLPITPRLKPVGSVLQALEKQQTQRLPQSPEDSALLEQFGYAQALVIPMVCEGQTLGAVSVFYAQPTLISGRLQQLAEALVNQATLALRNAQAYQQVDTALEARVEELSAIESISRKISGALNLEVIISEVLHAALEHTDADLVSVLLVATHELDHRVRLERFLAKEDVRFRLTNHAFEGVVGQVLRTGKAVRLEDTRLAPNYVQPTEQPMLSELCVPIIYKGQRVGALNLESRRLAAFNAAHERFLTNLAEHAAIALGTAQLFQRLEHQINTQQRLRALSLEMLTAGSLSAVLNLLVDAVIKTIRNGSVHLLLYESYPSEAPQLQAPALNPEAYDAAYQVVRLPIQRGGQQFGEFIISLDDPADLGDNRIYTLELIAIQAAIALQNVRLFEEVRARRDQMQTVFDAAREGMLLISEDGLLLLANRAAEQLLNFPLSAWQGRSVRQTDLPFATALNAALPREPIRRHYRLKVAETFRDIEETTIPVLDSRDQPVSRLIVLRDITQEEALKEFQQEVSNMLVHDLRGPITSVISSLQLLQDMIKAQEYAELDHVIEIALSSANAQLHLIESLLDIARLETRRMPMNLTLFALQALVSEVIQTFEVVAQTAKVRLLNQIAPDLPAVHADREQIKRVLSNLLDNALRHTPSGGQVRLNAQLNAAERVVVVSVTDTGKGVPPELRQRIFEKFVQISKSAVRGHRGSGLGLTFCQLAIEAHGGKIWVESGAEGGAAFFFTLPLAAQLDVPVKE